MRAERQHQHPIWRTTRTLLCFHPSFIVVLGRVAASFQSPLRYKRLDELGYAYKSCSPLRDNTMAPVTVSPHLEGPTMGVSSFSHTKPKTKRQYRPFEELIGQLG